MTTLKEFLAQVSVEHVEETLDYIQGRLDEGYTEELIHSSIFKAHWYHVAARVNKLSPEQVMFMLGLESDGYPEDYDFDTYYQELTDKVFEDLNYTFFPILMKDCILPAMTNYLNSIQS